PGWRLLRPLLDRRDRRQPIEGVVELDGVEALCVGSEPLALRHCIGVHDAAPVAVHPARATDARLSMCVGGHAAPIWCAATSRSRTSPSKAASRSASRMRSTADGCNVTSASYGNASV